MLRKRSLHELSRAEQSAYVRIMDLSNKLELIESDPSLAYLEQEARSAYEYEVKELMQKVENIADYIADVEDSVDTIKLEIERLQAREASFIANASRLKEYVMRVMEERGTDKLETPLVTIERRLNPEAVEVVNADLIPDEYKRAPVVTALQPDKTKIKEALKSGKEVAGTRLVRRPRLVMK